MGLVMEKPRISDITRATERSGIIRQPSASVAEEVSVYRDEAEE